MGLARLVSKLRGLNPAAQGFWAGHEGVGRGRGPRLTGAKAPVPATREIERAVDEGKIIEVGNR